MTTSAADDVRHEVGILCVHGIGLQQQGDTLLAIADPLLREMAEDGQFAIHGAVLRPQEALSTDPAHCEASLVRGGRTWRITVAESWWADVFPPPPYGAMSAWLLGHGSWIMLRHLLYKSSAWIRWTSRTFFRNRPLEPLETLWMCVMSILSMLVVAPVQIVLMLLRVLAWLPIAWLRTFAKRVMVAMSGLIGDTHVFATNPLIHQAIQARVSSDLDWLLARADTVVILAHSQGAAVAYDLMRDRGDLDRLRLVTYGAGIRKLVELERDHDRPPWIARLCPFLWLFTIVLVGSGWLALAWMFDDGVRARMDPHVASIAVGWWLVFGALFLVIGIIAADAEGKVDTRLLEEMKGLAANGLRWADLYASSDPVPGGPLMFKRRFDQQPDGWQTDADLPGFAARQVSNWASTIFDHTSYWQTPNDFVPSVAGRIWAWLGVAGTAPAPNRLRGTRIGARAVGIAVLVAAVLAVYLRARDPYTESLLSSALTSLTPKEGLPFRDLLERGAIRDGALAVAGALAYLAVLALYVRLAVDPAWAAWERAIQRRSPPSTAASTPGWIADAKRLAKVATWFVVCTLVLALPTYVLVQIARTKSYAGTWQGILRVLEDGQALIGFAALTVIAAFGILAVIAVGIDLYDRWHARRPTAAGPTADGASSTPPRMLP